MRVAVDRVKCISSGQCVLTAPEVFDQREGDGTSIVLIERPPANLTSIVSDVVVRCPSRAITVIDD